MEAIPDATAPLRSAHTYEIHPLDRADGWMVIDQAGQPAIVTELTGQARSIGMDWGWAVVKEHLAWRLVILRADEGRREVLRVAPRGEVVKYRMAAGDRVVCKLRQNLFSQRWRLYHGTETFAAIEVTRQFLSPTLSARETSQSVGSVNLGRHLPGDTIRAACLISALLCIRFDAGYSAAGGASPVIAGP